MPLLVMVLPLCGGFEDWEKVFGWFSGPYATYGRGPPIVRSDSMRGCVPPSVGPLVAHSLFGLPGAANGLVLEQNALLQRPFVYDLFT